MGCQCACNLIVVDHGGSNQDLSLLWTGRTDSVYIKLRLFNGSGAPVRCEIDGKLLMIVLLCTCLSFVRITRRDSRQRKFVYPTIIFPDEFTYKAACVGG